MISGFFEDTDVLAEDFARFASGILSNGVLEDDNKALKVTANNGMAVSVAPGYCWINGHFGKGEYAETFSIGTADGTNARYDRIVARLDYSKRKISIVVLKGKPAASPEIPAIVRDGTYYDLGLAVIYIRVGALAISNSDITDTRSDSAVCGGVIARTAEKLALDGKADKSEIEGFVTVGDVKMTVCTTAPKKWLICNGAAVSRSRYAALFSAIGTTYGEGDGSTTFNLPNLSGRVVVGVDKSDPDFSAAGKTGGEKTHKLTIEEMPAHGHSISAISDPTGSAEGVNITASASGRESTRFPTSSAGGGKAHNNLQPYMALNYIIYAGVV